MVHYRLGDYDDKNLEFGVKIMYDRIRVNNDNFFFDVFILNPTR